MGSDCKMCKTCKRCESCKRCKRKRVRVPVCRIMVHEDWDGNLGHGNDIALMEPVRLRETIRTIALPCGLKNHNFHRKVFKATGWGATNGTRKYSKSKILRMVKLPFVRRGTPSCDVGDNIICAGRKSKVNPKGVCSGDSGGPLAYRFRRKPRIVGISSFVLRKCTGISRFTRVTSFIKWIEEKT